MTAIYNEIEPYAARWLANLIAAGHVAPGSVDERSICDLEPADLAGPGQRHFFAGLGGWSLALRLAGVPDDAPIWTGSCPCQPLSVAGLQRGADDARHLWPAWHRLIAECRPSVVFGEQVAGRAGLEWLAAVRHDLEDLGYAVGAADLAAASIAAPQIRQRIFFGARLADRDPPGWIVEWRGRVLDGERPSLGNDADGCHSTDPWSDAELVECLDPKLGTVYRPAPPAGAGIPIVAHGIPGRVARLRAGGNAIVPQVAAAFVAAFLEVT